MAHPRFVVTALCALIGLTLVPAASASHVQCGDVITTDTRLDGDLTDCRDVGLMIGAPGVTLDLAGTSPGRLQP